MNFPPAAFLISPGVTAVYWVNIVPRFSGLRPARLIRGFRAGSCLELQTQSLSDLFHRDETWWEPAAQVEKLRQQLKTETLSSEVTDFKSKYLSIFQVKDFKKAYRFCILSHVVRGGIATESSVKKNNQKPVQLFLFLQDFTQKVIF